MKYKYLFLESLKDELNAEVKNTFPVYSNKSISDTPLNSTVKLAPLFRTVSVPDEQVPGLNHLVNRPQSWTLQPRSKRPLRGTIISLVYVLYVIK
jgi:hypothetical protein